MEEIVQARGLRMFCAICQKRSTRASSFYDVAYDIVNALIFHLRAGNGMRNTKERLVKRLQNSLTR